MSGRGAALIHDLANILQNDPLIDEVGLVPSVSLHALPLDCPPQSPDLPSPYDHTAFWVGDHKLAIALEVAREMATAAVALLKKARKLGGESVSREALLNSTQALVVVNPEHYTAWNTRKWLLQDAPDPGSAARQELQLSTLALSVHPKSEASWSHRRWVLRSLLKIATGAQRSALEIESALAQRCAELRPMNYRAWSHRSWAAQWMSPDHLRQELHSSRPWVEQHVTDNCGLHYRRRLMLLLLERTSETEGAAVSAEMLARLCDQERTWLKPLIQYYQGREALWLHLRFLAQIARTTDGEPVSPAPSDDAGGPVQVTHDAMRHPRDESEKGHAFPFPVWQSENRMLNIADCTEVHETRSAAGLNEGSPLPSAGSCALEDAFVTELVGRAQASSAKAASSTHAQLLLAGRHKLWARIMLSKEEEVST